MKPTIILLITLRFFTVAAPVDTVATGDTIPVSDTATLSPDSAALHSDTSAPFTSTDTSSIAAPDTVNNSGITPAHAVPRSSPGTTDSPSTSALLPKASDVKLRHSSARPDTTVIDTIAARNGSYFSAGIGWSLGGFTLLSLWENALPDSLGSFRLTSTSFSIPFDSTADSARLQSVDTALLTFSVKEKPAVYTMCFPLSLSLVRLRENDRFSFSLYGSWMRKIFAATIAATGDSLARKVDYRERMNVFAAFLSIAYGRRIPAEYFSIQEVRNSFFTAAVEIAPLIACTVRRTVSAPASDVRFGNLHNSISSPSRRFLHGSAAALRLGLNLVKRLNRNSATDFGIWYCVQGYGYFREDGNRVRFNNIDPANSKKGRPLYWISNRFEISFAIMRLHEK
ncbi:MAG: hypothetical protein JW913_01265 [Chitinispirillaceae bacterium]|nr:hypothetical protein [Chitinispirillaceae bacterium]